MRHPCGRRSTIAINAQQNGFYVSHVGETPWCAAVCKHFRITVSYPVPRIQLSVACLDHFGLLFVNYSFG